jgi:hypothetical protein
MLKTLTRALFRVSLNNRMKLLWIERCIYNKIIIISLINLSIRNHNLTIKNVSRRQSKSRHKLLLIRDQVKTPFLFQRKLTRFLKLFLKVRKRFINKMTFHLTKIIIPKNRVKLVKLDKTEFLKMTKVLIQTLQVQAQILIKVWKQY